MSALNIHRAQHSSRTPRCRQCRVCKGFVDSADVIPVAASPCCSIEITCERINLLTNQDSTDGVDELLGIASLFAVDIADV